MHITLNTWHMAWFINMYIFSLLHTHKLQILASCPSLRSPNRNLYDVWRHRFLTACLGEAGHYHQSENALHAAPQRRQDALKSHPLNWRHQPLLRSGHWLCLNPGAQQGSAELTSSDQKSLSAEFPTFLFSLLWTLVTEKWKGWRAAGQFWERKVVSQHSHMPICNFCLCLESRRRKMNICEFLEDKCML